MISELQQLQQKWPAKWNPSHRFYVAKLLLAVAPVARLVEHLETDVRGLLPTAPPTISPKLPRKPMRPRSSSARSNPRAFSMPWSMGSNLGPGGESDSSSTGEGIQINCTWDFQDVLEHENTINCLMELSFTGIVQYISPSCRSIFGYDAFYTITHLTGPIQGTSSENLPYPFSILTIEIIGIIQLMRCGQIRTREQQR